MKKAVRFFIFAVSFMALTSMPASAADNTFDLLRSIQSPDGLVLPHLPRNYTVPVTLTGDVAREIKTALVNLEIENPAFVETKNRGTDFNLTLANTEYETQTRDLIAGILNPIEMIEAILLSVVKYKEETTLKGMLRDAHVRTTTQLSAGRPMYHIRLGPKGDRFAYSYEDLGAYIQESWLESLFVMIDSTDMVARELFITRSTRTFERSDETKPAPKTRDYCYKFLYRQLDGVLLPTKLLLLVDGEKMLSLLARYRKQDKHIVFDSREMCYRMPEGKKSCLMMKYGAYEMKSRRASTNVSNRTYSKQLKKSSALANQAAETLKKGEISQALRLFKQIADDYPGTPHAVEARKLLEGLPGGL